MTDQPSGVTTLGGSNDFSREEKTASPSVPNIVDMLQSKLKYATQSYSPEAMLSSQALQKELQALQEKARTQLQENGKLDPDVKKVKLDLMSKVPEMMETILGVVKQSAASGSLKNAEFSNLPKLPTPGISTTVALYAGLQCKQLAAPDVERLIKFMGADISYVGHTGATCLHWACWNKRNDIVEVLLEAKADPQQRTLKGQPPLFWAAAGGDVKCGKLLLQSGADANYINEVDGKNAYISACEFGHFFFADYLRHFYGSDPMLVDNLGRTALHWACFNGHMITVSGLLAIGLDPRRSDSNGNSPLHLACEKDSVSCASLIFQDGEVMNNLSMLNQKNHDGFTPSDICKQFFPQQLQSDVKEAVKGKKKMKTPKAGRVLRLLAHLARQKNGGWRETFNKKTGGRFVMPGHMGTTSLIIQCFFWINQVLGMMFIGFVFWPTYPNFWVLHSLELLVAVIAMGLMFCLLRSNPGFIDPNMTKAEKRHRGESAEDIEALVDVERQDAGIIRKGPDFKYLRGEYKRRLQLADTERLCGTCQVWKINRSKHDVHSNRCVVKFDHSCPWVNRPVGGNNYRLFLAFTFTENGILFVTFIWACIYLHYYLKSFSGILLLPYTISLASVLLYAIGFNYQHSKLVNKNITTNEKMNWRRYDYLKEPGIERLKNPYDNGAKANFKAFLCKHDEVHFFEGQEEKDPCAKDPGSMADRSFYMMSLMYPGTDLKVNHTLHAGPEVFASRISPPVVTERKQDLLEDVKEQIDITVETSDNKSKGEAIEISQQPKQLDPFSASLNAPLVQSSSSGETDSDDSNI